VPTPVGDETEIGFNSGTEPHMLGPAQLIHTAIERNLDFGAAAEKHVETRPLPAKQRASAAVQSDIVHTDTPRFDDEVAPVVDEEEKKTIVQKITGILHFMFRFFESTLDKFSVYCNVVSRDYRYVAYVLDVVSTRVMARTHTHICTGETQSEESHGSRVVQLCAAFIP